MTHILTTADKIKDNDILCFNIVTKERTIEREVKEVSYYPNRKPFPVKVDFKDLGIMFFNKKESVYIKV